MKNMLENLAWAITVGLGLFMIYLFVNFIIDIGYSDVKYRLGVHHGPQDAITSTRH